MDKKVIGVIVILLMCFLSSIAAIAISVNIEDDDSVKTSVGPSVGPSADSDSDSDSVPAPAKKPPTPPPPPPSRPPPPPCDVSPTCTNIAVVDPTSTFWTINTLDNEYANGTSIILKKDSQYDHQGGYGGMYASNFNSETTTWGVNYNSDTNDYVWVKDISGNPSP